MPSQIIDPIAQSFFVETPLFLTKLDLFFSSKDDFLPITVKIRKNEAGAPSGLIMPFSEVVVPASSVLTSSNSNVATSVVFPSPVYLDVGEYSFTVGSDSKNYRLWVSELNEVDVSTKKRITTQPTLGSFFKSQNASTWTPSQLEDLKFRLYRAKFTSYTTANVSLEVEDNFSIATLATDPLEIYPGSVILKVYHFNHGFVNNSWVRLLNIANANTTSNVGVISYGNLYGIAGNTIQGVFKQVSNVKLDSYTITLDSPVANTVTSSVRFGGSGVIAEQDIQYGSMTPTIAIVQPSNTFVNHSVVTTAPSTGLSYLQQARENISNKEDNKFTSNRVLSGATNRFKKMSNASSLSYTVSMSTRNNMVSPVIDLKQAGLILKRNLVNSPSYDTLNYQHENVVVANNNEANIINLSNTIGVISLSDTSDRINVASMVNGTYITLTAAANANSSNDGLYRIISISDSGTTANVRVAKLSGNITTDMVGNAYGTYSITNHTGFVAEETPVGGSSYSKYITRQIDFINPCTSIRMILDASKPSDAGLRFFFKLRISGDNTEFNDIDFTEISGVNVPTSLNGEFYEVSKQVDNLPAFNSLIFKIVFTSTNEAQVPLIKNLRLIALE